MRILRSNTILYCRRWEETAAFYEHAAKRVKCGSVALGAAGNHGIAVSHALNSLNAVTIGTTAFERAVILAVLSQRIHRKERHAIRHEICERIGEQFVA